MPSKKDRFRGSTLRLATADAFGSLIRVQTTVLVYTISSLNEATAHLEHPVLDPRLLECARLVIDIHDRIIRRILGFTDCEKCRSSMTLFSRAMLTN
jgi:uncharacterized protein (DUF1810 family)